MARVIPFRGILYNKDILKNIGDVVAPPYDVISEEQQQALCDRHPDNIIRLILGEPGENEGDSSAFYKAAAERFKHWRSEGVLARDQKPAIYFTSVEFSVEGQQYIRYGIIAQVGLEPFENNVVLPHERTSSKVKTDRLNLMKETCANFCQIFSLFSDADDFVLNTLKNTVNEVEPDIDLVDDSNERHRLWRITDQTVTEKVTTAMRDKKLYIADGHHRYETALNYRKYVADNDPNFDENHPANYIMMYMSSMSDDGLIILPTHRLLTGLPESSKTAFIEDARPYFDIREIPFDKDNRNKTQKEFIAALRADTTKNTIGAMISGRDVFYLLTPKPNIMEEVFGDDVPSVLRDLDVAVLTNLILIKILGYSQAELDEEKVIDYTSDIDAAITAAAAGDCDIAFMLNPTKNEQMRDVAAAGEIMPRKTTFYYPKVLTGLVLSTKLPTDN
ncbi:MAG: DUF1015 domain-containing protein [Thermodesulfobacteriota bacterium]|nr:DUF1015 domain-containing protein [Thermodesulfobacteriota bacterium]